MLSTASNTINPLHRCPAVSGFTGKSKSTIYRDITKGLFTKPVSIGGDRVAWPDSEVQALNQARIAGKSEDQIKLLVIELEILRSAPL